MTLAVETHNLSKRFDGTLALNPLDLKVGEGEIFGLIGPNGAGKTTTLRVLATLIRPTSGSAEVFGLDVLEDSSEVRELVSYLPEEAGAYKNLSGEEYLSFMAGFYSEDEESRDSMVEEASRIAGLDDRLKDRVKGYSKGMKRRLLLSRSLMMKPKLAILDEPTSGLDVVHAYHVRRIVKDYVRSHGVTVLLSSHNMLEVEFLCDRVALIDEGSIVDQGEPSLLKEKYGAENLEEVFMECTESGR